jgi:hypothetical protein
MKPSPNSESSALKDPAALKQAGSVLLITLFIATLFGLFLFSYLYLVRNQKALVSRSQAWNGAMGLAEAGVDEALAQLNPAAPQLPVVDRTANGWGSPSAGVYGPMTRILSDGWYSALYTTDNYPILYVTGYVSIASIQATLARTIRVTTTNVPLFNVAFGAVDAIAMNGSGLASDSFNSANTNLSTNGQYDSSKTSTNGSVGSVFGPVSLGNHTIAGNLYLGPTAQYNSGAGQISGTIFNDLNIDYPDVVLPATTFLPALANPLTIGGVTYNHAFLFTGDYYISDSGSIYVAPGATVRLRVDATTFSPAGIFIDTTNGLSGTLTVYQVQGTSSMSGNITVQSGKAQNFFYYGLPGVTSITYGGTSSFIGCIYAPEADLTLNGGGSNNGLIGSSITKSITMNGHYNFHFDEALLSLGPARGYSVTTWTEL